MISAEAINFYFELTGKNLHKRYYERFERMYPSLSKNVIPLNYYSRLEEKLLNLEMFKRFWNNEKAVYICGTSQLGVLLYYTNKIPTNEKVTIKVKVIIIKRYYNFGSIHTLNVIYQTENVRFPAFVLEAFKKEPKALKPTTCLKEKDLIKATFTREEIENITVGCEEIREVLLN